MKKRKLFWLLISIAQIILSVVLSQSLNLDSAKVKAMGLLCASLTLWITETLPMSVATLFLVFFMPFLNLMTYDDIISNFGLSTSLFIMASSGITIAIARSNLPKMITSVIFQNSKKHPAILVYSLGMAITFFSGFVSSLATCSLFATLVSTALKDANLDAKNSRIGKALMIIIPACSGIGGFISPAGTPANIMVIDLLKEAGINLSFLQDTVQATPELSVIILRYFNPIGGHKSGLLGEHSNGVSNNLMPHIIRTAQGKQKQLLIFGNDYPTPDGTCIRDYIHVTDLAEGHVAALNYSTKMVGVDTVNLGTGYGTSILQLVKAFEKTNQLTVPYSIESRRTGDIAVCWASAEKANRLLGWKAKKTLSDMCRDSWLSRNCIE